MLGGWGPHTGDLCPHCSQSPVPPGALQPAGSLCTLLATCLSQASPCPHRSRPEEDSCGRGEFWERAKGLGAPGSWGHHWHRGALVLPALPACRALRDPPASAPRTGPGTGCWQVRGSAWTLTPRGSPGSGWAAGYLSGPAYVGGYCDAPRFCPLSLVLLSCAGSPGLSYPWGCGQCCPQKELEPGEAWGALRTPCGVCMTCPRTPAVTMGDRVGPGPAPWWHGGQLAGSRPGWRSGDMAGWGWPISFPQPPVISGCSGHPKGGSSQCGVGGPGSPAPEGPCICPWTMG